MGLDDKIADILNRIRSSQGATDNSVSALSRAERRKESRFNLNNRMPFSKRMPDQGQNYFVYGHQQQKFVPRAPDGTRMTEIEDPTYHSFDLEIVTNESPLYKQVWCYMDKYQLHPEFRSRHELYVMFMKVLSYYIKADDTPIADATPAGSEQSGIDTNTDETSANNPSQRSTLARIANSLGIDTNDGSSITRTSEFRGAFAGNRLVNTEKFLRADAQDLYNPESSVAVKKHYITSISGLNDLHDVPAHGSNYKKDYQDKEITINMREDVVQWTKLLTKLYNDMCYSTHNQRRIVPDNLLEFTLRIKVRDMRNIGRAQTAIQQFNNLINFDFRELLLDPVLQRAARHWGNIEQVFDKELSTVRELLHVFSFHRYTLYGCQFKYPMKYGLSQIDMGSNPAMFDGSSITLTYKRAYEEYASDMVPLFTTRGPAIMHLDNNDELLIRTGGLRSGDQVGSSEVQRAYSRSRTSADQLSTTQTGLFEDVFNNSPLLTGGKEVAAEALVSQKDQAVAQIIGDLRKSYKVGSLVPGNIYRPGNLINQVIQQAKNEFFSDIENVLFG